MARRTWGESDSERNRTEPSPNAARQPPVWKLKGSSLGPQLFMLHGQVVGPPMVLLLLIRATLLPVELLGPDTPLPVSGSAQR